MWCSEPLAASRSRRCAIATLKLSSRGHRHDLGHNNSSLVVRMSRNGMSRAFYGRIGETATTLMQNIRIPFHTLHCTHITPSLLCVVYHQACAFPTSLSIAFRVFSYDVAQLGVDLFLLSQNPASKSPFVDPVDPPIASPTHSEVLRSARATFVTVLDFAASRIDQLSMTAGKDVLRGVIATMRKINVR